MKTTKFFNFFAFLLVFTLIFALPATTFAQTETPQDPSLQPLLLFTQYPSRIIGFGETASVPLKLRSSTAETVDLSVKGLPEGWTASFRGGTQIVDAVYTDGKSDASVDLKLEPPADVKAGKYEFTVVAAGKKEKSELPLRFTIQEKLPARLSLMVDGLPTKQGTPSTTFNFTAKLKNEGGEDLLVALSAMQLENMQITIQSGGQTVSELQLAANEEKSLTIKADPLVNLQAGKYNFSVTASAGDVVAELPLGLEVVGEGSLSITTADGRLSGTAYAGRDNALKLTLSNNGTAALRGIELSSTEPTGWKVTFDQPQIAEIPAGQSVAVTAQITPAEKAVAGDYMISITARPLDYKQKTSDFRITVKTSTLWGVAGIGLIALAVAVVGIAVFRFGRR